LVAPGSYVLGQEESNSSLTTGAVVEAYLNFGIVGVFVVALLHGSLLCVVGKFGASARGPLDFCIFLLLMHFFSVLLVNAEFLGGFSGFLFITAPLILMRKFA